MEGLAQFHKSPKGINLRKRQSIDQDRQMAAQYRSMLNRLSEWKSISSQKAGTSVYDAYLKWVDPSWHWGKSG
jgi:hypothetical protein